MDKFKSNPLIFGTIKVFVLIVPIIVYFGIWNQYALNIPYFDDHALNGFLVKWLKSDDVLSKSKLLFSQHNEHRILVTRIAYLLVFYLNSSKISFVGLMLIGNLFLFCLVYIFCKVLNSSVLSSDATNPKAFSQSLYFGIFKQKSFYSWLIYLSITLIVFCFSNQENSFWGMASVQNFGVIALAGLLCYRLSMVSKLDFSIFLISFLCVFTSGNGILSLFLVALWLIIKHKKKDIFIWVLFSITIFFLYFFDYKRPPSNPHEAQISDFLNFLRGYLIFCGSIFDVNLSANTLIRILVSTFAGFFIFSTCFLWLIVILRKSIVARKLTINQNQLFILLMLGFVFGTGFLTVFARLGFGIEVLLTSRYKIYSSVLLLLCILILIDFFPNSFKKVVLFFLPVALFINLTHLLFSYQEIAYHHRYLIAMSMNYQTVKSKIDLPYQKPSSVLNASNSVSEVKLPISFIENQTTFSVFFNYSNVHIQNEDGLYICLSDTISGNKIWFAAKQLMNKGKKDMVLNLNYWSKSSELSINKAELPEGVYEVIGNLVEQKTVKRFLTNRFVNGTNRLPEKTKNW